MSKRFSCLLVDLKDEFGQYIRFEYENAIHVLFDAFFAWCKANDRVGAVVEYLEQEKRLPHTHFLYERANRKHNEFQTWLIAEMDG